MNYDEIYDRIILDATNEDLNNLSEAIRARRMYLAAVKLDEFVTGQRVVFNTQVRPKYMQGTEATIVRINRTKVVVQLDSGKGKFGTGDITVPTNLIDAL